MITYSATVHLATTGDESLNNTVSSTTVGSTCVPAGTNPACTTITSVEASTLTLTGLTQSFSLVGPPDSTVHQDEAVTMTVITNSFGGYTVTVQGTDTALRGSPGNSDTIPIDALKVRANARGAYTPISPTLPLTVYVQNHGSAPGGDAVSNDYSVDIPYVNADTYRTTLEYVVTAQ